MECYINLRIFYEYITLDHDGGVTLENRLHV